METCSLKLLICFMLLEVCHGTFRFFTLLKNLKSTIQATYQNATKRCHMIHFTPIKVIIIHFCTQKETRVFWKCAFKKPVHQRVRSERSADQTAQLNSLLCCCGLTGCIVFPYRHTHPTALLSHSHGASYPICASTDVCCSWLRSRWPGSVGTTGTNGWPTLHNSNPFKREATTSWTKPVSVCIHFFAGRIVGSGCGT